MSKEEVRLRRLSISGAEVGEGGVPLEFTAEERKGPYSTSRFVLNPGERFVADSKTADYLTGTFPNDFKRIEVRSMIPPENKGPGSVSGSAEDKGKKGKGSTTTLLPENPEKEKNPEIPKKEENPKEKPPKGGLLGRLLN